MKNNIFTVFLSAVILLASATIHAQEQKKSQASIRFKDGLTIVFTSETEPLDANRQSFGSVQITGENKVIHRVFTDTERGVYFGYDVSVEPFGESGQFKLSFLPLTTKPVDVLPPRPPRKPGSGGAVGGGQSQTGEPPTAKLTALSLPKFPDVQIVGDGDTIAFDVLENSKTGVKIVDLIKVLISTNQPPQPLSPINQTTASGGGHATRDFSIDAVEMKITSSRLIINGTPANENSGKFGIGVTGALVWFYAPGQGRFILSLAPRAGYNFQRAGTIQANKINFSMSGNQYEWISASPIVAGENDNWNLWILHQPDFVPDFPGAKPDSFLFGAADGIESLIRKK